MASQAKRSCLRTLAWFSRKQEGRHLLLLEALLRMPGRRGFSPACNVEAVQTFVLVILLPFVPHRLRGACHLNHFLLFLQKPFPTAMGEAPTVITSPTPVITRLPSAPHPRMSTTGTGWPSLRWEEVTPRPWRGTGKRKYRKEHGGRASALGTFHLLSCWLHIKISNLLVKNLSGGELHSLRNRASQFVREAVGVWVTVSLSPVCTGSGVGLWNNVSDIAWGFKMVSQSWP